MKPLRDRKRATSSCLSIVLVAGLASGAALPVQAQTVNAARGVFVDMSVLNDLGAGPGPQRGTSVGPGGLIMPSSEPPQSKLHVPPPKGVAPVTAAQPAAVPRPAAVKAPTTPRVAPATAPRVAAATPPKLPEVNLPKAPTVAAAPAPRPAQTAAAPAPNGVPARAPIPNVTSVVAAPLAPPPVPAANGNTQVAAFAAPAPPAALIPPPATPAAVTPAAAASAARAGQPLRVLFGEESERLESEWRAPLDGVIKQLSANDNLRLRLLAYAGGQDMPVSKARRLSLSRALAVRSYLIENGVRNTRIDVQALGNKAEGEPLNRVEVSVVER